jgi:NAD+ synthase (glutamine-hydrolysing)
VRVAMAQVAAAVGDVDGNVDASWMPGTRLPTQGADLVVFTELTITGYPPEDLLLKPEFLAATHDAVDRLCAEGPAGTVAVVGTVATVGDREDPGEEAWDVAVPALDLRNRAVVLADGEVVTGVRQVAAAQLRRVRRGALLRRRRRDRRARGRRAGRPDDLRGPVDRPGAARRGGGCRGAGDREPERVTLPPRQARDREAWVRHHATRDGTWVVYVNQVGGQDDVVFDGDSMLVLTRTARSSPAGRSSPRTSSWLTCRSTRLEGQTGPCRVHRSAPALPKFRTRPASTRSPRCGRRWCSRPATTCRRNGFRQVIVGLSGGIDSAVTAAVAADALGGENVIGLLMPSPYSSDHSLTDARELAANLGIRTHEVPSGPAMAAFDEMLADVFAAEDRIHPGAGDVTLTQENIQSRIRGMVVMALSNETGAIVLTTGNKSEYAVGYATLYGDMAGGFAPLKDVPKTLVFELARWRNRDGVVIPENTITKPPSAELKPDQVDQDSLPPYEVLDDIVAAYVEDHCGIAAIVARGHDETVVREVVRMIDRSEYKRRQAAPGPKVTARAFGKERRMPMTHGWRS